MNPWIKRSALILGGALLGIAAQDIDVLDAFDKYLIGAGSFLTGGLLLALLGGPKKGGPAALLLAASIGLSNQACKQFPLQWPDVLHCAPAPQAVVAEVTAVLFRDGGGSLSDRSVDALEELAKKHGPDVVACIVSQFINNVFAMKGLYPETVTSADIAAAERGKAFLRRIGVKDAPSISAPPNVDEGAGGAPAAKGDE